MHASVKEWTDEAKKRTKDAFCAAFPHPFLIGGGPAVEGPRGARTFRIDVADLHRALDEARANSVVLPVRKRLETFPSMISLGRTANNDLVLDDPQISKFHASLRFRDGELELEDAGSANGTFVGKTQLHKGVPQRLRRGDIVRFGSATFELYDAANAWGWLSRGR